MGDDPILYNKKKLIQNQNQNRKHTNKTKFFFSTAFLGHFAKRSDMFDVKILNVLNFRPNKVQNFWINLSSRIVESYKFSRYSTCKIY